VKDADPPGYRTLKYHQVHHILCHSCVQNAAIYVADVDRVYVEKCLAITDWNVNNAKNLIGLPLKSAYVLDADGGKYSESGLWDNLPCHQIDHNPDYTDAVKKWLHDNIWNTLKGKVDNCDVDPKNVKDKLDEASDHWKKHLRDRGKDQGGTKACWDERNGAKKDVWWIPFSMWPQTDTATIPKREAPPDGFKWNRKMKSILQKIN
jgi:hypothetical protein